MVITPLSVFRLTIVFKPVISGWVVGRAAHTVRQGSVLKTAEPTARGHAGNRTPASEVGGESVTTGLENTSTFYSQEKLLIWHT